MNKIKPFLWFDSQAGDAAEFYVSFFKNSKINHISYYPEGSPGPAGTPMVVSFELNGEPFLALNGGPIYTFSSAISLYVDCEDQEEVDNLWDHLVDGGEPMACGWVKDKFGVTWQIVPKILGELLGDPEPEKSGRTMQAMLQMVKLDIAGLKAAYDGK